MKYLKVEMTVAVKDDKDVDVIKRWEHHIDCAIDMDNYPEIDHIENVTVIDNHEQNKIEDNMDKKYELTKDYTITGFRVLYRIRALKDFGNVKAGDLGGFLENEDNLSHEGKCWVSDNARVFGNARISGNALVRGNARVVDNAKVCNNAHVSGDALVSDNTHVSGDALVSGDAWIYSSAQVSGSARVSGNAHVSGNAWISDSAQVSGYARVCGCAFISGDARVSDGVLVSGNAKILKDANIRELSDYMTIGPMGSRNDYTTFYKTKTGEIMVSCGCFNGTIDEFIKAVNTTHKDNETYRNKYLYAIEYIKNIKLGGK